MIRVLHPCLTLVVIALAVTVDGRPAAVTLGQKAALVSVVAEAGTAIRGLTAKDFIVKEDGKKLEVLDAHLSDDPLSIVLLIDTSQPPLGGAPPTQDLRAAPLAFVKAVHAVTPDAGIALVQVAGAAVTTVDFTSNAADLEKAIGRLYPSHERLAVLLEGLADAGKKLLTRPAPRRAIVSVDLHSPEGSAERTMKDAVSSVHDAGATLWTVTARGNTPDEPNREEVLNKATKANGGMRFSCIDTSGLEGQLLKVAASLGSQYVVTFARAGDGPVKPTTFETVGGAKVLLSPFMR